MMLKLCELVMIALVTIGLASTVGCKSDCEKAVDKALTFLQDEAKEEAATPEGRKPVLEACAKLPPEAQKCLVEAADQAAFTKCITDGVKKAADTPPEAAERRK
ncbi:MAG: hypothetical protein VX223_02345 [Myxococcota bacterium]|nr:hypothetical protein [Myxococcota bacterium]